MGIGIRELLLFWALLWAGLSVAVALYSHSKGTGFWFGLLASIVLSPLLGVIIVAIHEPSPAFLEQRALSSGELKKCPACAELIKMDARKCRHCTEVLSG